MKIISCSGLHKITVIILHGFNQDISEMEYISNLINEECDFIRCVILEGKGMKWYDYYTQRDNHNRHDKINYTHFTQSCDYLKKTKRNNLLVFYFVFLLNLFLVFLKTLRNLETL